MVIFFQLISKTKLILISEGVNQKKMSFLRSSMKKMVPAYFRYYSAEVPKANTPNPKAAAAAKEKPPAKEPVVGPGASKQGPYKNPEYFTYNIMSHYDIEKDMKPFRIPQPSSLKK
ncbi:uncharacterized protein LOC123473859 [Daphnia magna]|uniref:NADH dehydrogenase [ubiquinone] flavoprotein 3, mitochondrial n=1 Tax=Daphnia magna TaxID=35525 RepID=A0ABQ9ZSH7_9CRUS|nr:uncharacterized protein LOC123473859 [Daphnia magna]KAK4015886.1 hypothetical protein OUZ56_030853 [Daphnia magna]